MPINLRGFSRIWKILIATLWKENQTCSNNPIIAHGFRERRSEREIQRASDPVLKNNTETSSDAKANQPWPTCSSALSIAREYYVYYIGHVVDGIEAKRAKGMENRENWPFNQVRGKKKRERERPWLELHAICHSDDITQFRTLFMPAGGFQPAYLVDTYFWILSHQRQKERDLFPIRTNCRGLTCWCHPFFGRNAARSKRSFGCHVIFAASNEDVFHRNDDDDDDT